MTSQRLFGQFRRLNDPLGPFCMKVPPFEMIGKRNILNHAGNARLKALCTALEVPEGTEKINQINVLPQPP